MKDFLGHTLSIGDEVVLIEPGYRQFCRATIDKFTPQNVRLKRKDRTWSTDILQSPGQLIKVMNAEPASIHESYSVTVSTWENDADNYQHVTVTDLTLAQAKFTAQFAKLYISAHHWNGIGNLYQPSKSEIAEMQLKLYHFVLNFQAKNNLPSLGVLDSPDGAGILAGHHRKLYSCNFFSSFDAYAADNASPVHTYAEALIGVSYSLGLAGEEFFTRVCDFVNVQKVTTVEGSKVETIEDIEDIVIG